MKKFKSLIAGIFIFLVVVSMSKVVYCEERNIDTYINGKQVTFYNKPTIKNNVLLIPLEELFKNLFFDKRQINQISNQCKENKIGEVIDGVQMVPIGVINNFDYINTSINGNRIDFQVDKFEISFINQLDGKSIYIKNNDYDVLINTGNELDNKRMESFLNDNVYDKLDLIVVSDFDKNHIGGVPCILNNKNYRVNEFLYPNDESNNSLDTVYYENMIDALLSKKVINSKISNKENKIYQLDKDRYLEIEEIDKKLICKIKQGDNQILLLNDIGKSSQYNLAENEQSASIIQIDDSNELSLPLLRKMNPEEVVAYKYNGFSNENTKDYVKNRNIKVEEINTNLDYADITIKNGKFFINHESYRNSNEQDWRYIEFVPVFFIFILVINILINIHKDAKNISKNKNILSKFIDLCKFQGNNKLLSILFYIMFIVILGIGSVIEFNRQESISNNIDYLILIGMIVFLEIAYCIIIILIIAAMHIWQDISKDLYRNKRINRGERVFFNIFAPILAIVFYYLFFELRKGKLEHVILQELYIIFAVLLILLNFIEVFKGIILTMSSNEFLGSSRGFGSVMIGSIKFPTKNVKKQLKIKLSIIFSWFIIIYLNSSVFLYIISKIPNNNFIESVTQKPTDLFGIFYLTIITLFTIGYGDIIPVGIFARLGIILVILIGSFFTLLAIGKIFGMGDEE